MSGVDRAEQLVAQAVTGVQSFAQEMPCAAAKS